MEAIHVQIIEKKLSIFSEVRYSSPSKQTKFFFFFPQELLGQKI